MRKYLKNVSAILILIFIAGCCKIDLNCDCSDELPQKLVKAKINPCMKGWELYSWPQKEQGCNDWNYAIMPGTNSLKSYSEVTSDTVFLKVIGKEQLKKLLNKFPKGESITWIGDKWLSQTWGPGSINYGNLKLPSPAITEEIKQHSALLQLNLLMTE